MLLMWLQMAQSRSYVYTLGPKVDSIYIPGAPGFWLQERRRTSKRPQTYTLYCSPQRLRHPKYHPTDTIRPLTEVDWGGLGYGGDGGSSAIV